MHIDKVDLQALAEDTEWHANVDVYLAALGVLHQNADHDGCDLE